MKMAQRKGVVEEGVPQHAWQRVHPLTPVFNGWQVIAVLIAVVLFQNIEFVGDLGKLADSFGFGLILLVAIGALLLILLVVGVYSYMSWRAMTYAVTDQAVWLRRGILFRQQRHVRLERIQAVDVSHPLLGRIFGLGRLRVDAAGGANSSLTIGFLRSDDLFGLRADILARAAGITEGNSDIDSETYGAATQEPVKRVVEADENLLYSVNTRTLVTSLALSMSFMLGLLALAASLVAIVIVGFAAGWGIALSFFPTWIPIVLVVGSLLWSRFSKEFNFQAAVSPDGIRVRRGLLEQRAETIPPRRIHAVEIHQPLLWRRRDWYRVLITQATRGTQDSSGGSTDSQALLPVGTREEAMLALWLVLPDLGVDDPVEFFDEAVRGRRRTKQFTGIPHNARVLDPLVKNRRGVALTRTCMVVRDGWVVRTAAFAPYERIQSVLVSEGPITKAMDLASVTACLVPGPVNLTISHLSGGDSIAVSDELVKMSRQLRGSEPPERWFRRVNEPTFNGEVNVDPADLTAAAPVVNPAPLPEDSFKPPEQLPQSEEIQ